MNFQLKKDVAILYFAIVFIFALLHFNYREEYHNIYTMTDAVYFSAVTSSTTGYGEIYPKTQRTKQITTLQIIFTALLTVLLII